MQPTQTFACRPSSLPVWGLDNPRCILYNCACRAVRNVWRQLRLDQTASTLVFAFARVEPHPLPPTGVVHTKTPVQKNSGKPNRGNMKERQGILLLIPLSICLMLLTMASTAGAASAAMVTVSPSSVTIPAGGDQRLTATVTGSSTTAVTWTVNNIPGGNSTVGTIDNTGRYAAPAQPPVGWTVTVRATSVANPSASAACAITVRIRHRY